MKTETLTGILKSLNKSCDDIESSAIMTTEGLMIASLTTDQIDQDRVGAMAAAMLSIGTRTSKELSRGPLQQVMVKGESGYVIVFGTGSAAVLTVVTKEDAKLGLVFLEASRSVKEITKALF